MSALRHEYRHFFDDQAAGFKGFEGVFDRENMDSSPFASTSTKELR